MGERSEAEIRKDVTGPLGVLLWQLLRDVKLWSSFAPEHRAGLFTLAPCRTREWKLHALDQEPEIRPALETLLSVVEIPEAADQAAVVEACRTIVSWADGRGMVETALQYAEAWAASDPASAQAAATAGQFCARIAEIQRAEIWFRRGIVLGRRAADWEWYIRGHLRLGGLLYETGDYRSARIHLARASDQAARHGLWALAGQAQHDLFTVEIYTSSFRRADARARRALELYPVRSPIIPYLAHDYAYLLVRHACYTPALRLLNAALLHIPDQRRTIINATLARAYAGCRDAARYRAFSQEVLRLVARSDEGAAMAFVLLGDGARSFEEWDNAEYLTARGVALAMARSEPETQRTGYEVLDRITAREPARREQDLPRGIAAEDTIRQFLSRLAKQRAPMPTSETGLSKPEVVSLTGPS